MGGLRRKVGVLVKQYSITAVECMCTAAWYVHSSACDTCTAAPGFQHPPRPAPRLQSAVCCPSSSRHLVLRVGGRVAGLGGVQGEEQVVVGGVDIRAAGRLCLQLAIG